MRKPNVGEIVQVIDPDTSGTESDAFKVIAVFDSLDEDWGVFGESAWAQMDHNQDMGRDDAEWYIIGTSVSMDAEGNQSEEPGSMSLASWEVRV